MQSAPRYERTAGLYGVDEDVTPAVRQWCVENGSDPLLRIALCGYDGDGSEVLESLGWSVYAWKARGGYGSQSEGGRGRDNSKRERIWFSPNCLAGKPTQLHLW